MSGLLSRTVLLCYFYAVFVLVKRDSVGLDRDARYLSLNTNIVKAFE